MILQLNQMVPFNNGNHSYYDFYDSYHYPKQEMEFINKKVRIRFKDYNTEITYDRLPISRNKHPEFDPRYAQEIIEYPTRSDFPERNGTTVHGEGSFYNLYKALDTNLIYKWNGAGYTQIGRQTFDDIWWKILRFDQDKTDCCILADEQNRVIVTTVDKIYGLLFYEGYERSKDEILVRRSSWDKFNNDIANDYIHSYPVQNEQYLGCHTFSEYTYDLIYKDYTVNKLEANDGTQIKRLEEIRKEMMAGDSKWIPDAVSHLPDYWLKSFNAVYDSHNDSYMDRPRRAINQGIVIRCDQGGTDPHFVVRETDKKGAFRYVTEMDAFFYIDSDEKPNGLKGINLWQD